MNRRHVLKLLASGTAALALPRCGGGAPGFPTAFVGADHALGHRLREGGFAAPVREERMDVLLVGAGVAGLSAARSGPITCRCPIPMMRSSLLSSAKQALCTVWNR